MCCRCLRSYPLIALVMSISCQLQLYSPLVAERLLRDAHIPVCPGLLVDGQDETHCRASRSPCGESIDRPVCRCPSDRRNPTISCRTLESKLRIGSRNAPFSPSWEAWRVSKPRCRTRVSPRGNGANCSRNCHPVHDRMFAQTEYGTRNASLRQT
jgi:hypothetical protein